MRFAQKACRNVVHKAHCILPSMVAHILQDAPELVGPGSVCYRASPPSPQKISGPALLPVSLSCERILLPEPQRSESPLCSTLLSLSQAHMRSTGHLCVCPGDVRRTEVSTGSSVDRCNPIHRGSLVSVNSQYELMFGLNAASHVCSNIPAGV